MGLEQQDEWCPFAGGRVGVEGVPPSTASWTSGAWARLAFSRNVQEGSTRFMELLQEVGRLWEESNLNSNTMTPFFTYFVDKNVFH